MRKDWFLIKVGLNSPGESDPLTHTQVRDLLIFSLPWPQTLSPARVLQPLLCLSPSLCFFGPLPSDFCICYSKEFALGKVTRNLLVVRSGRCQYPTLPDLEQQSASLTSSSSSLLCFPGFHPHLLLPHREPTGVCFPASSFSQK